MSTASSISLRWRSISSLLACLARACGFVPPVDLEQGLGVVGVRPLASTPGAARGPQLPLTLLDVEGVVAAAAIALCVGAASSGRTVCSVGSRSSAGSGFMIVSAFL